MKNRFYSSFLEMKNLRVLIQCALFIALYIVLNSFSIRLTPEIKFSLSFMALAAIAMIAGPTTAFFCGGIVEVLGYAVSPGGGAFHPGIAFTTMLSGLVMGLFFYRREIKLWRVICARGIISVFFSLGLNTFWLSTLMGKAYLVLLPTRLLKAAVLFPIEIVLTYAVMKIVAVIQTRMVKANQHL